MYDWLRDIYVSKKKDIQYWKTNYKAIVGTGFFFSSLCFFKSFFIRFALTELFFLVGNPAGGLATERCLAAAGAALTAKAPSKDTSVTENTPSYLPKKDTHKILPLTYLPKID